MPSDPDAELSFPEIAAKIGSSWQAIQQSHDAAIKKLRKNRIIQEMAEPDEPSPWASSTRRTPTLAYYDRLKR